jgi:hypothetical protein
VVLSPEAMNLVIERIAVIERELVHLIEIAPRRSELVLKIRDLLVHILVMARRGHLHLKFIVLIQILFVGLRFYGLVDVLFFLDFCFLLVWISESYAAYEAQNHQFLGQILRLYMLWAGMKCMEMYLLSFRDPPEWPISLHFPDADPRFRALPARGGGDNRRKTKKRSRQHPAGKRTHRRSRRI